MSSDMRARQSENNIRYLDYSEFMGIPCGTVIRNEGLKEKQIEEFVIGQIAGSPSASHESSKLKYKLIKLNQKHTNNIVFSGDYNKDVPADGAFTNLAGHILTVRTADCFPIFISDGKFAAIIHAGWRGVLLGIIRNFFNQTEGIDLDECKVVIGPGIGGCCFEVSPEVAILFDNKYRTVRNKRYYVDVRGLIVDEITEHGVKYIKVDDACTSCNVDRFYSYRREGIKVKQMLSYIYSGG